MIRTASRFACVLALVVAGSACEKKPEARPDDLKANPPSSTAAASASAAPSTSAQVAASSSASGAAVGGLSRWVCVDGTLQVISVLADLDGATLQPSGFGGLGLSGTGGGDAGTGEGIGLGTVGGFGHGSGVGTGGLGGGAKPHGISMRALTAITAGKVDVEKTERALCGTFVKLRPCFDALDKGKTTLTGTALLTLAVAADGHVTSVAPSGTLVDPALTACITPVVLATALPSPEGGAGATIAYTIDYARYPGSGNVKMIESGVTITGALPPEVVRRIVRANFPRIRACYEAGTKKDPTLGGTVFVDFVIDSTGAVETAKQATGGSLADAAVGSCITGVFRTLSFPEPEKAKVNVHYGIDLSSQ